MIAKPLDFEITVPVYNGASLIADTISLLVDSLDGDLGRLGRGGIVVVDNGSTDATDQILSSASSFANFRHIRLAKRGLGLAVKSAWLSSEAAVVGYVDADCGTISGDLARSISHLIRGEAHLVVGTRYSPAGSPGRRALHRTLSSLALNHGARALTGTAFSDLGCGFKFISSSAFRKVWKFSRLSDGWAMPAEVMLVAEQLGLPFIETNVRCTDKECGSTLRWREAVWDYARCIAAASGRGNCQRLAQSKPQVNYIRS